jgi:hypothetical protein
MSKVVQVVLSDSQYEELKTKAGSKDISSFVRGKIVNEQPLQFTPEELEYLNKSAKLFGYSGITDQDFVNHILCDTLERMMQEKT